MILSSIISKFDRVLTPIGFKRRNTTWNRQSDEIVDVIDIQISKNKDSATMNAGVLSRTLYLTCWGRESEPFVKAPYCIAHARIGELLDQKDIWWK